VPEIERTEGEDPADSEEEFERPVLDTEDSNESADEEDKDDDVERSKDDDQPEEKTIYDKISDEVSKLTF